MKKISLIIGITLILIQSVIAYGIVSDDYSVDSYHTGLAGQEPTNSQYDSRFTFTYQQAGEKDAENLNYKANIGWFSLPSYCGDGICDDDENCSSCPSDCGVCPTPPDGNGGNGAAACTYDWVCSDWYLSPCPANGIQERVCVNRGTCSGTEGMPSQTRNCTPAVPPGPAEPLFDIFANIPLMSKWLNRGDPVEMNVKLINLGNITPIDVFFKYWIIDENNTLITELQETRAISERDEFKIKLDLSTQIKLGMYKFYVQINYDLDKVAIAQDSFEVVRHKLGKYILLFLLVGIIFLVILVLIILISKLRKSKQFKNV